MRSSDPLASEVSGAVVESLDPLEQLASMSAAVNVAAIPFRAREVKSAKVAPFVGGRKISR